MQNNQPDLYDPRPANEPQPRDFDLEDEIAYIKDEMRFEREREEQMMKG